MRENNKKKEEELICVPGKEGEMICAPEDQAVHLEAKEKTSLSPEIPKKGGIFIGTLNLFTAPAKAVKERAKRRYHRHYHPKHKHGFKHLAADLVLAGFVLILVISNLYIYLAGGSILPPKLELEGKLSLDKVLSGEDITFTLSYFNKSKIILKESKLSLNFPKHFLLKEVSPQSSFEVKSNTFDLGDLEPGANGRIRITGEILGGLGGQEKFTGLLNFTRGKTLWRESRSLTHSFNIEGSKLDFNFDLPKKLVNNQPFELTMKYENKGVNDLAGLILNLEGLKGEKNEWSVGALPAGQKGEIKAKFYLDAKGKTQEEIKGKIFLLLDKEKFLQKEVKKNAGIIYPKFLFDYKINGKDNLNVTPGQTLEYIISYHNKENSNIHDLSLSLDLKGEFFDFKSISSNVWVVNGKIVWDKNVLPGLALVNPGQGGEIKFKIAAYPSLDPMIIREKKDQEIFLTSQLDSSYKIEEDLTQTIHLLGKEIKSKINSDLSLNAYARYYTLEGDQLGRGLLPPVVGLTTKYWIYWQVKNNLNAVKDLKVSALLPKNVQFTGKSSVSLGDKIEYNSIEHKVSWFVKQVPRLVGETSPSIGAFFEVALTPTTDQAGKEAFLLQSIKMTGQDDLTKEILSFQEKDLTTNLIYDKKALGKSKVLP